MSAASTPATTECPSPYIENCTQPSDTTTTTIAIARDLPDTGTNATQTFAFAGVLLVVVGVIAAIAGRRRTVQPTR